MVEEKRLVKEILSLIGDEKFTSILCCGRGGLVPSAYLAHALGIKTVHHLPTGNTVPPETFRTNGLGNKVLIVDDISDTGDTLTEMVKHISIPYKTAVLYERITTSFRCDYVGQPITHNNWITFDWEK
jgi:hypoxanthine phosphoribosyltransferase